MVYVFFNPLADNGNGEEKAKQVAALFPNQELSYLNVTEKSVSEFLSSAAPEDTVVLAGGDGTLNRFANDLQGKVSTHPVYYFACGSGNDFMSDVKEKAKDGLILLNPYLENLPTVEVNGKEYYFINGIGYGIDGYCCEVGDAMRAKSAKKINYASIAVKGLLFHFKPRNATVTVDGKEYSFRKVWLAPSMNGRYYGGGMNVAPAQDRLGADKTLSVVVMYKSGKLKTLMVFPSIFKGEHVKHTKMVQVLTGKTITVAFDKPCALQIDGETILNVSSYTVHSASAASEVQAEAAAAQE